MTTDGCLAVAHVQAESLELIAEATEEDLQELCLEAGAHQRVVGLLVQLVI